LAKSDGPLDGLVLMPAAWRNLLDRRSTAGDDKWKQQRDEFQHVDSIVPRHVTPDVSVNRPAAPMRAEERAVAALRVRGACLESCMALRAAQ
jgi:hypothetical protein